LRVPQCNNNPEFAKLGKYVNRLSEEYNGSRDRSQLTGDLIEQLEDMGFEWKVKKPKKMLGMISISCSKHGELRMVTAMSLLKNIPSYANGLAASELKRRMENSQLRRLIFFRILGLSGKLESVRPNLILN
jgi:hypothetical protein